VVHLETNASGHVLEPAGFFLNVISAASSFDVLVVRAALQKQVAFGKYVSSVRVVSRLVPFDGVRAIVNLDVPVEFVNCAVFFLMRSAYGYGQRRLIRMLR
jgi:hypothetical protein